MSDPVEIQAVVTDVVVLATCPFCERQTVIFRQAMTWREHKTCEHFKEEKDGIIIFVETKTDPGSG